MAAIPAAEIYWFLFASSCLVTAVFILIDRRLWFTRPADTVSAEAVPSPV